MKAYPDRKPTPCPLCRKPLTAADIAASPGGEYPTHYACRVALQEAEERAEQDADECERGD